MSFGPPKLNLSGQSRLRVTAKDDPVKIPIELRTTLILRNLPKFYSRSELSGLFDNNGFASEYDFIFAPLDGLHQGEGIAVVNLVHPLIAARFWDTFDGFTHWWRGWCKEVCEVEWYAEDQGLDELIARFRNSKLMSDTVPDECKPGLYVDGELVPFPPPTRELVDDGRSWLHLGSNTTLMLKNVPTTFTRENLLALFNWHGFMFQYNFFFLPRDFKTGMNQGYAFVNLVSPRVAAQFVATFDGFWWPLCDDDDQDHALVVSWSQYEQGYEENVERYRNSPLMHEKVEDEFKPVIFANGHRVEFPPSTIKLRAPRAPRMRHHRHSSRC